MVSKHIISIPKNEKLQKRLQDNNINQFTTTLHVLTPPQDQFTQFLNQIHNIQTYHLSISISNNTNLEHDIEYTQFSRYFITTKQSILHV